jgi:putative tryptophan/tyrosine transport system substrate-binding protein
MRRREFIAGLGLAASSAVWPRTARAQQPKLPVLGFLGATTPEPNAQYVAGLRQGLKESGFVEGENVTTEYRWAEGRYDRLPALAAELVNRQVTVIVPIGGAPPTLAAKAATSTIPIVFNMGGDPVRLGVVASLGRPGGNVTGVAMLVVEIQAKRLELLCELVPAAALIAVLVNPNNPQADAELRAVQEAARTIRKQVLVLTASTEGELETAIATLVQRRGDALLVGADTFFGSQFALLHALTMRHRIPAAYYTREAAAWGGLMSYGTNFRDAYRQTGVYVGRVLKGAKPAELPVTQATKFEFVLNLKTAKALGIDIPLKLHAFADEVIE